MTPEKREELKSAALAATPGPYILEQGDGELDSKARWPTDAKVLVFADNDCEHHPVADFSCNHSCRIKFEQEKNALFFSLADPSAILFLIAQVEALTVPADYFAPVVLNPTCACAKCNPNAAGRMMILCATCGNKRCPRATDHRLACTDSNEPGQVGSSYGPTIPAIPGTKEGA